MLAFGIPLLLVKNNPDEIAPSKTGVDRKTKGDRYMCQWVNGVRNGHGVLTTRDWDSP